MNLRLTAQEFQVLRLWGKMAKDRATEVGVPFEADEERLLGKLQAKPEGKGEAKE